MDSEQEELAVPVSPIGQYFTSSALSLCIFAVLEFEEMIDESVLMSLINDVFIPINPRFSSLMVKDKNGVKHWKKVEVKLNEHAIFPLVPEGMSLQSYDEYLYHYLSKLATDQLPHSRPLWEIHGLKYPTGNGSLIFKLHHALGDGYSLMGALLSCLQRADNPSLPLTFPSTQKNSNSVANSRSISRTVPGMLARAVNTIFDLGSLVSRSLVKDDHTPVRSGDDGVEFQPITITTSSFSLDHIRQIKDNLQVTINDVVTGMISLGTRLYMQTTSHGSSSSANCTALVLLSTRNAGGYKSISEMVKPNAEAPWGNQLAYLHIPIPKVNDPESSNPLGFVLSAHRRMKRKRNSGAVFLTTMLLQMIRKYGGPEATARYIHKTLKRSSMTISNMIGPIEQMALANHPVKGFFFMTAGLPQSLTTTVVSYMGTLRVAVGTQKGLIDPYKFQSCLDNAFDMIFRSAIRSATV